MDKNEFAKIFKTDQYGQIVLMIDMIDGVVTISAYLRLSSENELLVVSLEFDSSVLGGEENALILADNFFKDASTQEVIEFVEPTVTEYIASKGVH
jgi:hypothetical protein